MALSGIKTLAARVERLQATLIKQSLPRVVAVDVEGRALPYGAREPGPDDRLITVHFDPPLEQPD